MEAQLIYTGTNEYGEKIGYVKNFKELLMKHITENYNLLKELGK